MEKNKLTLEELKRKKLQKEMEAIDFILEEERLRILFMK
jgi:hypothetical protein